MTESGNHANGNGHGPFRRYSPPSTQNGSGAAGGQDIRFSSGAPSGGPTASAPGASQIRANRSARRRWRQWVQPQTPPPPNHGGSNRGASGPSMPPGAKAAVQPIPRPSTIVTGPPSPPATLRKEDSVQRPQTQPLQPPANRQAPTNKVTPLRQRPVWSTPPDIDAPKPPTKGQDGRRTPRRRPRSKTPRPVVGLVQLLIGGIGLAAIAGTLLSVLNPDQQETAPAPVVSNGDSSLTVQGPINPRGGGAITAPLPLADKLTYLENTLLELESLAPGLSQATFVIDLDSGNYVDINGAGVVAAASTIKLPILVAFLNAVDTGQITLDQGMVLQEDLIVGGSGEMQVEGLGTRYTALEVATRMMTQSDNTATQMMIELLGGNQALNQQFQDWGLTATVLRNRLPDLEGTNTTSAQDLVRILALVEQGELLSLRSRDRLFGIMQRTYSRDLIPGGVADEEALVFNKTGDIGSVLGDVALVDAPNGKRYVLATLVERPHNDGRASELIRRIAELIHGEMNQPVAPIGGAVAPEPTSNGEPEAFPSEASPNGAEAEIPRG